jgi:hypothetical protein
VGIYYCEVPKERSWKAKIFVSFRLLELFSCTQN